MARECSNSFKNSNCKHTVRKRCDAAACKTSRSAHPCLCVFAHFTLPPNPAPSHPSSQVFHYDLLDQLAIVHDFPHEPGRPTQGWYVGKGVRNGQHGRWLDGRLMAATSSCSSNNAAYRRRARPLPDQKRATRVHESAQAHSHWVHATIEERGKSSRGEREKRMQA